MAVPFFFFKIDHGLFRVIGLKYGGEPSPVFEIFIFWLMPFIVPPYNHVTKATIITTFKMNKIGWTNRPIELLALHCGTTGSYFRKMFSLWTQPMMTAHFRGYHFCALDPTKKKKKISHSRTNQSPLAAMVVAFLFIGLLSPIMET